MRTNERRRSDTAMSPELALGQHLDHFESLAGELAVELRAPWLRERAARPLSRALRTLLARTFRALEALRADHAQDLDLPPAPGLARQLYLFERDLDAARQLVIDAGAASGDETRRSLRYFELVRVRIPDAFVLRNQRQGPRLGGIGEAMIAVADDVEGRVARFLEVLSTEKVRDTSAYGKQREWSKRFLPDFWDLELIKRQTKAKKPG